LAYIQAKKIPICHVYCHPDIICSHPHLIAYYRSIAGLSQKGVQHLAFGVKALEERKGRKLSKERAIILARLFNRYISAFIDGDPKFSIKDVHLVGMMNFGSQINGSWRNEIGIEGSRRVKELLLKYLLDHRLISEAQSKDGSVLSLKRPLLADDVLGFTVTNNYKVIFGSEPDISIISPKGILDAAIEVKAGIDPAGALERYGAAKKSFDRALRESKSATTIYLASCITEGVKKAISDDRLVRREFNLTDIFVSEEAKEEFLEYIKWLMHL